MLKFFRNYERYFYIIVTVVIVISFSFFGTYDVMTRPGPKDTIAFTAVDGTKITGRELDEMVHFLRTDIEEKQLYGGTWGANFLNDGVVKKDFLESGLAKSLSMEYADQLKRDLEPRLKREQTYQSYSHPGASFINAKNAWDYLAPDVAMQLSRLKSQEDPVDSEAIDARIKLYLAERKFPAPTLKQVLSYQQQQFNWVQPDPQLPYRDLSLFEYHNVTDWFGPKFVRLVAEMVINGSKVAERKGYHVSEAEALADLKARSDENYSQNINNPNLGVTNATAYFNEQLRRLNLDSTRAANIWRQVLLFRRLFKEGGESTFVDQLSPALFNEWAYQGIEGDQYQLPDALHMSSVRELQKFQKYLQSIEENYQATALQMPTRLLSTNQVKEKTPSLVQKRYLIDVSSVDLSKLSSRVPVKETWEWEVDAKNWELLKENFPVLGTLDGESEKVRFASLDSLDRKTRAQLDHFARRNIVKSHPEWIEQALSQVKPKREELALRLRGGKSPFPGWRDANSLSKYLETLKDNSKNAEPYSPDDEHYYSFTVYDRSKEFEILTYGEANREEVLDQLLDQSSEKQDLKPLLNAIKKDAAEHGETKSPLIDDIAASLRFFAHMRAEEQRIKENGSSVSEVTNESEDSVDQLSKRPPLADQWRVVHTPIEGDRTTPFINFDKEDVFALSENEWSKVYTPRNGDLNFLYIRKQITEVHPSRQFERVMEANQLLSHEAQQILMQQLIEEVQEKNAISI